MSDELLTEFRRLSDLHDATEPGTPEFDDVHHEFEFFWLQNCDDILAKLEAAHALPAHWQAQARSRSTTGCGPMEAVVLQRCANELEQALTSRAESGKG